MPRSICILLVVLSFLAAICQAGEAAKPSFIIILADDLGYGDLSCYGHPSIETPHLDQMAREGMRFTQFYSAAEVCTPSRAALLTGRLPPRSGMCSNRRRVLFPDSKGGLPAEEITIAELLKDNGYATACIGKWHLGHLPPYSALKHGFDYYYGLPYSNDMDRVPTSPMGRAAFLNPKNEYWNVPLLRGTEIIERPADQNTLAARYTDETIRFIQEHKDQPFFVYLPHTMPHVPLFSEDLRGQSPRGLYGDVVREVDQSVGRILETLRKEKLAERTLVIFTSDNGPWLTQGDQGGTAGLLRDGKGSTFEGGMRVPAIAWMPGRVKADSVSRELASTLDLLPTMASMSGLKFEADRAFDGHDISPVFEGGKSPRTDMFYYRGFELMAVRLGPWKAHFQSQTGYGQPMPERHDPPLLYNLEVDPSERFNVAAANPEVLTQITDLAAKHRQNMRPAQSQLE